MFTLNEYHDVILNDLTDINLGLNGISEEIFNVILRIQIRIHFLE